MGIAKKKYYEKPVCIDSGKVASVLGDVCSDGHGAGAEECLNGIDPTSVPTCFGTGSDATNDCNTNGSSAGSNCVSTGGVATVACIAGDSPQFCGSGSTEA